VAHLRPILDATLAALPGIGQVAVVQARKTYVSLVLRDQRLGGRLKSRKGVGNGSMTVSLPLTSPTDLDDEALGWLKRAYDENA